MISVETMEQSVQEKEKYWQEQSVKVEEILKLGAERYFHSLPNSERAFQLSDRNVRCIDEGLQGGINLAGSGILLDEENAEEILRKADVDGVWSHEGCGAAELYAAENNLDPEKSDEYGIEWAKKIAGKLNVPYKGHVTLEQMHRPAGFHIARVAYYDGTGQFDPLKISELPAGFVISRKYLDPEYARKETEIAFSIANGNHGFGGKITKEEPFLIIPIGDSRNSQFSYKTLKKELHKFAGNDKILIDGFDFF